MTKKVKYYVVWNGRQTGVFDNWGECKASIDAFPKAQFKSFESKELANKAFREKAEKYIFKSATAKSQYDSLSGEIVYPSIAVDAACSSSSLMMEYQGVDSRTKKVLFHRGPFPDGTNNIGEFLAIVHALAILHKQNIDIPIYSDSRIAIGWVKKKKHASVLKMTANNKQLFQMLEKAEKWLKENRYKNQILKWETRAWGENPADFGRK